MKRRKTSYPSLRCSTFSVILIFLTPSYCQFPCYNLKSNYLRFQVRNSRSYRGRTKFSFTCMLIKIKMKILCLFPFLVSNLCPCNENGIQFEFAGSKITIHSETRPWPRFQIGSFPARTFVTVEYLSEEFGLTVKRTESDCMIFSVFGKVNFNLTFGP